MRYHLLFAALLIGFLAAVPAGAGEADVVAVQITATGANLYRFDVTVRHQDTGWEHYSDRWEVLAPDGRILATRKLLHPHEYEQPFTRSLSGVEIPGGTDVVTLRARDSVHGLGGKKMEAVLPR